MKFKILYVGLILIIFACSENDKLPTVITNPITEVTWQYAITGGEVINDGGSSITKRGVCVSEDSQNFSLESYGTWYTIDSSGFGSFASKVGIKWHGAAYSLRDTHYVRAYAINSAGTAYGEVLSFYPGDKPLSECTITISSISTTSSSAVINFNHYFQIYSTVREAGFCYSTSPNPCIDGVHIVLSQLSDGQNSVTIENLNPNTEYYIRGYQQNQAGIVYSAEKKFTTEN